MITVSYVFPLVFPRVSTCPVWASGVTLRVIRLSVFLHSLGIVIHLCLVFLRLGVPVKEHLCLYSETVTSFCQQKLLLICWRQRVASQLSRVNWLQVKVCVQKALHCFKACKTCTIPLSRQKFFSELTLFWQKWPWNYVLIAQQAGAASLLTLLISHSFHTRSQTPMWRFSSLWYLQTPHRTADTHIRPLIQIKDAQTNIKIWRCDDFLKRNHCLRCSIQC